MVKWMVEVGLIAVVMAAVAVASAVAFAAAVAGLAIN